MNDTPADQVWQGPATYHQLDLHVRPISKAESFDLNLGSEPNYPSHSLDLPGLLTIGFGQRLVAFRYSSDSL